MLASPLPPLIATASKSGSESTGALKSLGATHLGDNSHSFPLRSTPESKYKCTGVPGTWGTPQGTAAANWGLAEPPRTGLEHDIFMYRLTVPLPGNDS